MYMYRQYNGKHLDLHSKIVSSILTGGKVQNRWLRFLKLKTLQILLKFKKKNKKRPKHRKILPKFLRVSGNRN
jgi:hypothetical protein